MQTSRNNIAKHLKLIALLLANKALENVATRKNIIQLLGSGATLSQDLTEASELLDGVALVLAQLLRTVAVLTAWPAPSPFWTRSLPRTSPRRSLTSW
jgi:hypothetical protein